MNFAYYEFARMHHDYTRQHLTYMALIIILNLLTLQIKVIK